jgi:hypothetical protein
MPTPTAARRRHVPVDLEIYRGVVHDFIKMGRAIPEARRPMPTPRGRCGTPFRPTDSPFFFLRDFAMKRQDFRFFHRLRVRWAEVDMQKIVFNAHYLMYFDTAIADYWRAMGCPMRRRWSTSKAICT